MVFVSVCTSRLAANALGWAGVAFGIRKHIESEPAFHRESDLGSLFRQRERSNLK